MNDTENQIATVGRYQIDKLIDHLNKTLIEPLEPDAKPKTKLRFKLTGELNSENGITITMEKP